MKQASGRQKSEADRTPHGCPYLGAPLQPHSATSGQPAGDMAAWMGQTGQHRPTLAPETCPVYIGQHPRATQWLDVCCIPPTAVQTPLQ